jgi:hypothetical protein
MMYMIDARQSAQKVETMWHCHKLRLANGHALVVTREWWDVFLKAYENKLLTNESASTHTLPPEAGNGTHGMV